MIKTTLPTVVKQGIDETSGNLIMTEKEITVYIDTSLFAEERWESNFPHNAKNETLFAYIERVCASDGYKNKAAVMSNLKALYCFMEGEDIPDFKSFCQLFDISSGENLDKLIKKMEFVFKAVLSSSASSSKN